MNLKQHFYGYDSENKYNTLAVSNNLNPNLRQYLDNNMSRTFSNLSSGDSEIYMIRFQDLTVFGCVTSIPPKNGIREYCLFHNYIFDINEILEYLDSTVQSAKFITENNNNINIDTQEIPMDNNTSTNLINYNEAAWRELINIASIVMLGGRKQRIFFACNKENNSNIYIRNFIAKLIDYIPLEARRNLSFVTKTRANDERIEALNLIFCDINTYTEIRDTKYSSNTYFCDLNNLDIYNKPEYISPFIEYTTKQNNRTDIFAYYDNILTDYKDNIKYYDALFYINKPNNYSNIPINIHEALFTLIEKNIINREQLEPYFNKSSYNNIDISIILEACCHNKQIEKEEILKVLYTASQDPTMTKTVAVFVENHNLLDDFQNYKYQHSQKTINSNTDPFIDFIKHIEKNEITLIFSKDYIKSLENNNLIKECQKYCEDIIKDNNSNEKKAIATVFVNSNFKEGIIQDFIIQIDIEKEKQLNIFTSFFISYHKYKDIKNIEIVYAKSIIFLEQQFPIDILKLPNIKIICNDCSKVFQSILTNPNEKRIFNDILNKLNKNQPSKFRSIAIIAAIILVLAILLIWLSNNH